MLKAMLARVGVFIFFSCTNPFSIRQPEEPNSSGLPFIAPRTADVVLLNLQNAILEQNIENYIRCFSDSGNYSFVPDPGVASENQALFADWTREDERNYFGQLQSFVPPDSLHVLNFKDVEDRVTFESTVVTRRYILKIHHTQQSRGVPSDVRGEARYWMSADQFGDWSIYLWEDFAINDSSQTWSTLKAEFGN